LEPNTTITKHRTARTRKLEVVPTLIWLTTNSLLCQSVGLYIPNLNFAVLERIFSKFPPTFLSPGFRFEKYAPKQGSYRKINLDLAGNVILDENQQENNVKDRNFVLFGVGLSYKPPN
jgi:hypothetical protein